MLEDELTDSQIATSYCLGASYKGVFRPPLGAYLPATVFIKRLAPRLAGTIEHRDKSSFSSSKSLSTDAVKTRARAGSESYLPIPSERVLLWYCPRIVLAAGAHPRTPYSIAVYS